MARTLHVSAFFHPGTSTYSYVAWDAETRKAAVIDSVMHYEASSGRTATHYAEQIIDFVRGNDLELEWVLETHAHADHVAAGAYIKSRLGGTSGIGAGIRRVQAHFKAVFNLERGFMADGSQFDHLFEDGETFHLGNLQARALATPGHTPDHLTYLIGDAVFVGDTLFMPDGGTARCDFPGGDAGTLYDSIGRLFKLPEETRLFVLHDYAPGGRDYRNETTVGEQKRDNIHVGAGKSREAFIRMRTERDRTLGLPELIIPSVQLNVRAGSPPPAEDNGVRYVKIPLDHARAFSSTIDKEPELS